MKQKIIIIFLSYVSCTLLFIRHNKFGSDDHNA